MALEIDGIFYDVERLEEELGSAIPIPCDPWDFHTRVAALGCAGLAELDAKLRQGQRPTSARVGTSGVALLAACDTDRAAFVHVDVRDGDLALRIGHAPSIFGQDALVDMPEGETRPEVEIGLGVIVGEDLRAATAAEAKNAIVGVSILIDWLGLDRDASLRPRALTARGTRTQLGPYLVPSSTIGRIAALPVELGVGGVRRSAGTIGDLGLTLHEAVAWASRDVTLRAGDVVGVGPLPLGTCQAHGISLRMHERVEVRVERLGALRGAAVPRA